MSVKISNEKLSTIDKNWENDSISLLRLQRKVKGKGGAAKKIDPNDDSPLTNPCFLHSGTLAQMLTPLLRHSKQLRCIQSSAPWEAQGGLKCERSGRPFSAREQTTCQKTKHA